MTTNKRQLGLVLLETFLQGVLIFFTPRALRLLGALGNDQQPTHIAAHLQAPTSQRTKPKACKRAAILPSHLTKTICIRINHSYLYATKFEKF